MYYTYIIRCNDNSLYTGITNNIERRMHEHFTQDKSCAKYTKTHQAIKLEAVWQSITRSQASKLEFLIKRLKKQEKEEIILYNNIDRYLCNHINVSEYIRLKEYHYEKK